MLLDVEHVHVRFMGNLVLNLWDCGGQYRFYESYFDSQRDTIFRNVEVLIYVFDIESAEMNNDFALFDGVIEAMEQNSPDASIFVLIHKMDLVPADIRQKIFADRENHIKARSDQFNIRCFGTSIWDETLYRAWSTIVHSLIPNAALLENQLSEFQDICGADEVVLFEKATFLVISSVSRLSTDHYDDHRFERISNIIKQFKLSCSKTNTEFEGMELSNSKFRGFIEAFTSNTYMMIISLGPQTSSSLTRLNIAAAKKHFEKFIPAEST